MILQASQVGFASLLGACLGSFISTAVVRQLRGEQALAGRSRCDGCARPLAPWAMVPVLSYAMTRGGCRRCGAEIDRLHPAGELLGAAIMALAWSAPVMTPMDLLARGLVSALGLCLLGLSLYDARTLRIPNALTLGVLVSALGLALLHGPGAALPALVWGVLTFAGLDGLRRLYQKVRSVDGLGLGDVKLLGALAVWLQAEVAWALLLASASALLWIGLGARHRQRLAFGPFLAFGALAVGLGRPLVGVGA